MPCIAQSTVPTVEVDAEHSKRIALDWGRIRGTDERHVDVLLPADEARELVVVEEQHIEHADAIRRTGSATFRTTWHREC